MPHPVLPKPDMKSDYRTRLPRHTTLFSQHVNRFSSILHDFPQFPHDLSEQHLALDHDTSSQTLSSISMAGNHITERCALSESDRDISVDIETRIRPRRSGVRITAVDFPISKHVQIDPNALQFSTSMGTFLSRV